MQIKLGMSDLDVWRRYSHPGFGYVLRWDLTPKSQYMFEEVT
jgi:hypothetical protein